MKKPAARHTTVPASRPPRRQPVPRPKGTPRPSRPQVRPAVSGVKSLPRPAQIARIVDADEKSLVDVIDSLLNQGVMLNADLVLALANVDLVYLRLSALLCAADRLLPMSR